MSANLEHGVHHAARNESLPRARGLASVSERPITTPATMATPTAIAGVTAANSVAVGDLNDDGLPDLVAGLSILAVNGLKVFLNDGTGGFIVAGSFASGHPDSIVIGDFDDDGRQDVAFTSGAACL